MQASFLYFPTKHEKIYPKLFLQGEIFYFVTIHPIKMEKRRVSEEILNQLYNMESLKTNSS